MPALGSSPIDDKLQGVPRVLITGFGPFRGLATNPSWMAVKQLHNQVINAGTTQRRIHITALEVPVIYETVLKLVPALHARPPILPEYAEIDSLPPPPDGYDLIIHVGLGGTHVLRLEAQAHKHGYTLADITGKPGPLIDGENTPEKRGFDKGYESFGDILRTNVAVEELVGDLQKEGIACFTSYDPGRYLCDFIYYGSMAEARRAAGSEVPRPVLFLHVSGVGQPTTTEEVVVGLVRITAQVLRIMI
ncbi:hypothetical protein BDV98DRAFT_612418 [Pterulicium gracile]|uniref:Peptidase C15, pyroglutamyl peptidase I-like protein n=1 Tax=Pterulicium gracile TaxID=1884261 RepID=A0A5C3QJH2_9AGAR|nr:hypothetical protein BDV98DRAFT_612418 [Pterula gracilis]